MQDEGHKKTTGPRPEEELTVASLGPLSASTRAEPIPGERIGKYVVERTLGRGGMGVVVLARHEQLDERVAIKVLHSKAATDAVHRERFVREARSTVRIKSEHVVRVLDAGVEEGTGTPFIVMEYLDGVDLGQLLTDSGPMRVTMAVDCIIQICEAVSAAHALGIIHRDLKPSNFLLTRRSDGSAHVKVLDFGISKAIAEDGIPDPRLTETQAVFGSPTYMSPEQIRSSKNVDVRSDVWSLGVALFELLTGKLPFVADNVAGLLASVIADAPFRLTNFVAVPDELEHIVLACLEKDPARRISSAHELAARLMPFASADVAHLAARMKRVARGGSASQSFPPVPLSGSRSYPPFPSVAFGTTETDLSATGPAAHRLPRKSRTPIVIGAFALVAILVAILVGIGTLVRERERSRVAAQKNIETSAPLPSPLLPPSPEITPPVLAATHPATPPALASGAPLAPLLPAGKRGKPYGRAPAGVAPPATGATVTAPPPASPPTTPSTNLDSRF